MEFNFATTELRGICESRKKAAAALGVQAAHALKLCLADLAALPTMVDLGVLFEGSIIERSVVERSICFQAGYDLVFRVGHVKVPQTASGATDWSKVSRIKILSVGVVNG